MERSKLKTIIILILLLVNIFLLVLVGGQLVQEYRAQRTALANAGLILEQNGIAVSDEALTQMGLTTLASLSAARDTQFEAALATALLGEDAACTNQSGGLYVYTGEAGSVLFRAGGEFTADFTVPIPTEDTPQSHSEALLRTLKLSAEEVSWVNTPSGEVEGTFLQTVEGVPVYTCSLVFRYTDKGLASISGTLLPAAPSASSGAPALDGATALIRFLSGILDSGDVCSSVTAIRPGYRMTYSFSGSISLSPVWLVSTDASAYYLDGITGQLSRVNG